MVSLRTLWGSFLLLLGFSHTGKIVVISWGWVEMHLFLNDLLKFEIVSIIIAFPLLSFSTLSSLDG